MNHAAITERYRPQTLDQVVGQPAAVEQLKSFLDAPHAAAFVFHGPTGVGKTAAAKALALDLGCVDDPCSCGGLIEIPSGRQDGRAVEDLLRSLRLRPMLGSGWRVAVINEADSMTTQAEAIWLDGLESLPPKSVIVLTTNELRRLTRRLIGRCELVGFDGDSPGLLAGLRRRCAEVWAAETGEPCPELPANLGRYEMADSPYSIRLALQQLGPMIRARKMEASVAVPFIRTEESDRHDRQIAAGQKAAATRRTNQEKRSAAG